MAKTGSKRTVSGMSVKDQRAAAAAAGQSMSEWKSGYSSSGSSSSAPSKPPKSSPSPSPSPSPSRSSSPSPSSSPSYSPSSSPSPAPSNNHALAKERSQMSVKERRDAAKKAGMSMKEFKSGASTTKQPSQTYKPGHSAENTTAYGKTIGEFTSFDDYKGSHWASHNPNMDQYKQGGKRMSSEGLYQDRYNVGYHGDDDLGDEYASTSFQGSVNKTFDKFRGGEQNFFQAYQQYVGSGRDEGYAGDVLKLIDSGKLKVSDDQYNMVVTDAKNYDWDKRGEIAGSDAGQAFYDSRLGGEAASHTAAMNDWYDSQQAMGLEPLQTTQDIGELSTEQNQPFSMETSPYQRKYSLESQGFMKDWMNTKFS